MQVQSNRASVSGAFAYMEKAEETNERRTKLAVNNNNSAKPGTAVSPGARGLLACAHAPVSPKAHGLHLAPKAQLPDAEVLMVVPDHHLVRRIPRALSAANKS